MNVKRDIGYYYDIIKDIETINSHPNHLYLFIDTYWRLRGYE